MTLDCNPEASYSNVLGFLRYSKIFDLNTFVKMDEK